MSKKEKITFWIIEVVIVLSSIISVLFLNGFSAIMIAYGILIGALYGTLLLICIMSTYYAIKKKKVYFAIAGIITVPLVFFMLLSMINMFTTLWFAHIAVILAIIDVLYIFIALSIQVLKK